MPDASATGYDWNGLLIASLAVLAIAALIISLLLSRHLIKRPVESGYSVSDIKAAVETRERLLYCASFFEDIYSGHVIPDKELIEDFQQNSSVIAEAFKGSGIRDICSAFCRYHLNSRPLPDYTARCAERLKKDGREGDALGAFCLYARDEFSRLLSKLDSQPDKKTVAL